MDGCITLKKSVSTSSGLETIYNEERKKVTGDSESVCRERGGFERKKDENREFEKSCSQMGGRRQKCK